MNIPNLPTDNLYKFIALFGLVVFLFSFIFPFHYMFEAEIKLAETAGDVAFIEAEIKSLDESLKNSGEDSGYASRAVERLDKIKELRRKIVKERAVNRQLIDQLKFLEKVMLFGGILGGIMMALGFVLWYSLVQRFLDIQLKKSTETSTPDISLNADS